MSEIESQQHIPVLDQVIDGNANQQKTGKDVDETTMTGEPESQLALECSREQRKDQ
jgi:hypothetical protein